MKIKEAVQYGMEFLGLQFLDSLNSHDIIYDVQTLLCEATRMTKEEISIKYDYILSNEEFDLFKSFLTRRLQHEPIHYIIGHRFFYGYKFLLNNECLIPRFDSETLIINALEYIKNNPKQHYKILDLCCGSGCLGIAFALESNINCDITFVDISSKALEATKQNINLHCIKNTTLINEDIFNNKWLNNIDKFDIIFFNPPYIQSGIINSLDKEVKMWEPITALDGGKDGLMFYHYFAKILPQIISNSGAAFCEIGYDQGSDVVNIFTTLDLKTNLIQDISGNDRCIVILS